MTLSLCKLLHYLLKIRSIVAEINPANYEQKHSVHRNPDIEKDI